jgi:hypothetical protein
MTDANSVANAFFTGRAAMIVNGNGAFRCVQALAQVQDNAGRGGRRDGLTCRHDQGWLLDTQAEPVFW